jgi:hypothetical protein
MAKIFKLRPKAEEDLIEIYTYSAREWGNLAKRTLSTSVHEWAIPPVLLNSMSMLSNLVAMHNLTQSDLCLFLGVFGIPWQCRGYTAD